MGNMFTTETTTDTAQAKPLSQRLQTAPSGSQNLALPPPVLVREHISTSSNDGVFGPRVFQHFYPRLVEILPMNDVTFLSKLYSVKLLPGNMKDQVQACPTQADKATYFLDHVIKPSVISGVGKSFDSLLAVMENSEYDGVKELAKMMRNRMENEQSITNADMLPMTCTAQYVRKSSPVDTTIINRLQSRYCKHLSTSGTDWPRHYIRLALVKEEKIGEEGTMLEEITRLTLQGQVDEILLKKEPLSDLYDIFHYQSRPCPRVILVMGAPGIGKTTLANEICIKWARDGFLADDFDIVLLIPLRSVQERSVEEIVTEYIGGREAYEQLKKSGGVRSLVILEGLDEIAVDLQRTDKFLVRVVKNCTLLEQATILITSRPHACEKLNAGRRIEVVGFGKKEIEEFVMNFFADPHFINEFLYQLDEYPHIHSLCYIPMNLLMILDIFQVNKKKLPSTVTQLYQLFIVMVLQRQIEKANEEKQAHLSQAVPAARYIKEAITKTFCKVLPGIPEVAIGTVFLLSRLAYCGFFEWCSKAYWRKQNDPKIIFSIQDLIQCGIELTPELDGYGLLKATHTHQLPKDTITYSFTHLTIQEFLCALYMSTMSDREYQLLLNKHFNDYPNVFVFLCGLTGLASHVMRTSQFICYKLTSVVDVVTVIKCVYESQQTSLPHLTGHLEMDLSIKHLSPYDCECVSYVLSYCPVAKLSMAGCHIGNEGAKTLVKYFPNKSINGVDHVLQELDLYGNDLTVTGLKLLTNIIIKSSISMRVLDIGKNNIGDDGILLLTKSLLCSSTELVELWIYQCGLSVEGASYICEFLKKTNTLTTLTMGNNAIGDDGIAMITGTLQYNSTLSTLRVEDCQLTVIGARYIGELLAVNSTLQVLWMSANAISDDGITAIAETLGNSRIKELDINRCSITLPGIKPLAAALSVSQNLRIVNLHGNSITMEGACLILQSAVESGQCHQVVINKEYWNDEEAKRMITVLEDRAKTIQCVI